MNLLPNVAHADNGMEAKLVLFSVCQALVNAVSASFRRTVRPRMIHGLAAISRAQWNRLSSHAHAHALHATFCFVLTLRHCVLYTKI